MNTNAMGLILSRIHETTEVRSSIDIDDHSVPFVMQSRVGEAVAWDRGYIESVLNVALPPDLVNLWDRVSYVRLFEDTERRTWGLHIASPEDIIEMHSNRKLWRNIDEDFGTGDLIIGEFIGDADALLLRCDNNCDDYGHVLVMMEIDPRKAWPTVGRSLADFLTVYLDKRGDKFWEST